MKRNIRNVILVVSVLLILGTGFIIYKKRKEYFEGCVPATGSSSTTMPTDAAEACKVISSRAEEIEAEYKGIQGVIKNIPVLGLFNPNNYKAGDNTTDDMMRNIVNVNMSKCEVEEISNSCSNLGSISQINRISTLDCPWCQNPDNRCDIVGNRQINRGKIKQTCGIKIAIKMLSSKKNSVDAQALAKVLQKADGIMSGDNTVKSENCNIISQDLSTDSYLSSKSECLNALNLDQKNILESCSIIKNYQENISESIQTCVIGTDFESEEAVDSSVSVKKELDADQTSVGINTAAFIVSSISSTVCSSLAVAALYIASTVDLDKVAEIAKQ